MSVRVVVLLSRPQEREKALPYIGYGKVAASALLLDQAKVSLILHLLRERHQAQGRRLELLNFDTFDTFIELIQYSLLYSKDVVSCFPKVSIEELRNSTWDWLFRFLYRTPGQGWLSKREVARRVSGPTGAQPSQPGPNHFFWPGSSISTSIHFKIYK